VLTPNEESRVLMEEGYRNVGVKEAHERGMKVIRRIGVLAR